MRGPLISNIANASSAAWMALDRHAVRRNQGLPTISLLIGPTALGARAWRRWAGANGSPVFTFSTAQAALFIPECVAALARTHDLADLALKWLQRQTNAPEPLRLAGKTLRDFEHWWRGLPALPESTAAAALARTLCEMKLRGREMRGGEPRDILDAAREAQSIPRPGWHVLEGIDPMLPARPALLFTRPPDDAGDADSWLIHAAPDLAGLCERLPAWPVAAAATAAQWDKYDRAAPPTRDKSLLAAGAIRIETLDPPAIESRLRAAAVNPQPIGQAIERLSTIGASEELVQALADAARVPQPDADQARSAAERFLFELLEALPETTGRFALNSRLGFAFGPQDAEVDLLAASLRLVIEIDGYHHFTDADRYRRDRRKDWELQRHGYTVLRFLADDVVADMENVLARIVSAVDYCGQQVSKEKDSK